MIGGQVQYKEEGFGSAVNRECKVHTCGNPDVAGVKVSLIHTLHTDAAMHRLRSNLMGQAQLSWVQTMRPRPLKGKRLGGNASEAWVLPQTSCRLLSQPEDGFTLRCKAGAGFCCDLSDAQVCMA